MFGAGVNFIQTEHISHVLLLLLKFMLSCKYTYMNGLMTWRFYILFNSVSVISKLLEGEFVGLCASPFDPESGTLTIWP